MDIPEKSQHFTPLQLDLLRMFAADLPQEQLTDIKRLIGKYFLERLRNEMDEHIAAEGKTPEQWNEEAAKAHFRRPDPDMKEALKNTL